MHYEVVWPESGGDEVEVGMAPTLLKDKKIVTGKKQK